MYYYKLGSHPEHGELIPVPVTFICVPPSGLALRLTLPYPSPKLPILHAYRYLLIAERTGTGTK
jgi:hypothetical protein